MNNSTKSFNYGNNRQIHTYTYTYIYIYIYIYIWVESSTASPVSVTFLFKMFWSVWRRHGNIYRDENFKFSVGFINYLAIHVIVAVPAALVYLENLISYIGIKARLLSSENVYFQSKFILTHTLEYSITIIIQLLSVHFLD